MQLICFVIHHNVYIVIIMYMCGSTVGEPIDLVEEAVEQVDQRWSALNSLLTLTKAKVTLSNDTKQFYEELTSLRGILLSYERWINTVEGMADEAL